MIHRAHYHVRKYEIISCPPVIYDCMRINTEKIIIKTFTRISEFCQQPEEKLRPLEEDHSLKLHSQPHQPH